MCVPKCHHSKLRKIDAIKTCNYFVEKSSCVKQRQKMKNIHLQFRSLANRENSDIANLLCVNGDIDSLVAIVWKSSENNW